MADFIYLFIFITANSLSNMSVPTGSLIYEKLGERAFGWPGKMAAFGSIIMQNIGGGQCIQTMLKSNILE